jgi:hypothetical protein
VVTHSASIQQLSVGLIFFGIKHIVTVELAQTITRDASAIPLLAEPHCRRLLWRRRILHELHVCVIQHGERCGSPERPLGKSALVRRSFVLVAPAEVMEETVGVLKHVTRMMELREKGMNASFAARM